MSYWNRIIWLLKMWNSHYLSHFQRDRKIKLSTLPSDCNRKSLIIKLPTKSWGLNISVKCLKLKLRIKNKTLQLFRNLWLMKIFKFLYLTLIRRMKSFNRVNKRKIINYFPVDHQTNISFCQKLVNFLRRLLLTQTPLNNSI